MHSTPKHALDASIHLCFLDELAPISLFDAFSNFGLKAILFFESAGAPRPWSVLGDPFGLYG
jgi:hypothetical protein